MKLLKAFRFDICILACLLAYTSFKLSGLTVSLLVLGAYFFISTSIMLQNDWRDRFHDLKKGKSFASEHSRLFLGILLIFWGIAFTLVGSIFLGNISAGFAFLAIMAIGLIYSEVRKIPLVPATLVAFIFPSPLILPLAYEASTVPWLLYVAVFMIVFGRELMKDIDDARIDSGYKWTLAVKLGCEKTKLIAMSCIAIGIVLSFYFFALNAPLKFFAAIVGLLVATAGLSLFGLGMPSKTARLWLDAGMAISIFGVMIF